MAGHSFGRSFPWKASSKIKDWLDGRIIIKKGRILKARLTETKTRVGWRASILTNFFPFDLPSLSLSLSLFLPPPFTFRWNQLSSSLINFRLQFYGIRKSTIIVRFLVEFDTFRQVRRHDTYRFLNFIRSFSTKEFENLAVCGMNGVTVKSMRIRLNFWSHFYVLFLVNIGWSTCDLFPTIIATTSFSSHLILIFINTSLISRFSATFQCLISPLIPRLLIINISIRDPTFLPPN